MHGRYKIKVGQVRRVLKDDAIGDSGFPVVPYQYWLFEIIAKVKVGGSIYYIGVKNQKPNVVFWPVLFNQDGEGWDNIDDVDDAPTWRFEPWGGVTNIKPKWEIL